MSLSAVRHGLALSPAAAIMRRCAPLTSSGVSYLVMQSSINDRFAQLVGALFAMNEIVYSFSDAQSLTRRRCQLIHECNYLVSGAAFALVVFIFCKNPSADSFLFLLFSAPQILSLIHSSHPVFHTIEQWDDLKNQEEDPSLQFLKDQIDKTENTKNPIVLDFTDCSSDIRKKCAYVLSSLSQKNKVGNSPCKILELSVKDLMSYGNVWEERLDEVMGYLKISEGNILLLINLPKSCSEQNSSLLRDFAAFLFVYAAENVRPVLITASNCFQDLTCHTIKMANPLLPPSLPELPPLLDYFKDQGQAILESLSNQNEKKCVCLVGDEEKEKELLIDSLKHLLKTKNASLQNHQILSFHFIDLLQSGTQLQFNLIDSFRNTNNVLYVHGIEAGLTRTDEPNAMLNSSLKLLLNYPDLKLIISTSKDQQDIIERANPGFKKKFTPHTMTPLF